MTVLFKDTFTDANNVLIANHTPDSGASLKMVKTAGMNAGIVNNQLHQIPGGSGDTIVLVDVGQLNVKFSFTWAGVHAWNGAVLRSNADGSSSFWFGTDGLYDTAGVKIGTMSTPIAGDKFEVTFNGNSVTVTKNAVQIINTTTNNAGTNTMYGFGFGEQTAGFDDVQIEDLNTGGTGVTITGIAATSTADAIAPVVSAQKQITISSIITNVNADTVIPTITTTSSISTSISGVIADAMATANNPVLSLDVNVLGVIGSANADAGNMQVGSITNVSVNAVIVDAIADAINPSVFTTVSAQINSIIAGMNADSINPTIQTDAVISAVIAELEAVGLSVNGNIIVSEIRLKGSYDLGVRLTGKKDLGVKLIGSKNAVRLRGLTQ